MRRFIKIELIIKTFSKSETLHLTHNRGERGQSGQRRLEADSDIVSL